MLIKFAFTLIVISVGVQGRQYDYQKPLVPFYNADGKPHYLTTANRMIIPTVTGHNYEVSMSSSNKFVEMRVQQQGFAQQQPVITGQSAGHTGGAAVVTPSTSPISYVNQQLIGNSVPVGQVHHYQQNPTINGQSYASNPLTGHTHQHRVISGHNQAQTHSVSQQIKGSLISHVNQGFMQFRQVHHQQFSAANNKPLSQHPGIPNLQQQQQQFLAPNNQPLTKNPGTPNVQVHHQQFAAPNNQPLSQHPDAPKVQQQQQQFPTPNSPPLARLVTKCYPNGRCEQQQVAQDQQHSTVLQQARSHIAQAPSSTCNSIYAKGKGQGEAQGQRYPAVTKSLRDRRLVPYSEVIIPAYPYNK
ncbi:uncharacterized protein [Musca autumnalis]|uniref:uncharacterized protein n=1 Tax=Musca autumnalis TaxID=221902 RepID=UPI003CE8AE79